MSSVVLLALPADRQRAEGILNSLAGAGRHLRFDRTEPGSPDWRRTMKNTMEAPGAMFLWSAAAHEESAAPYRWLAHEAIRQNKAILVRIDGHRLPDEIPAESTYDLSGWRGRLPGMTKVALAPVVEALERRAEAPGPRSGSALLGRWLLWTRAGFGSAVTAIVTAASVYLWWAGSRPSSDEETVWRALRAGPCAPLARFRERFPNGFYREEARLLSERNGPVARWITHAEPTRFAILSSAERALPSRDQAYRVAMERARAGIGPTCRDVARRVHPNARNSSGSDVRYEDNCQGFTSGFTCDLTVSLQCRMEIPDPDFCKAPSGNPQD